MQQNHTRNVTLTRFFVENLRFGYIICLPIPMTAQSIYAQIFIMKYFLTLNLISCLFLTACGGSSSSTSSTAPVIAPKETTPTESLPHTVTKGIEMLAQAKLAATSESKLTTSLFKKVLPSVLVTRQVNWLIKIS